MTLPQRLQAGPDDRGLRLDVFIAQRLSQLTRSQIQSLNRSGAVLIEGRREKAGYRIRGDEAIEIELRPAQGTPLAGKNIPFAILYEDDDLAVIEKPAGLVVHPGAGTGDSTVVHGLLYHFRQLSGAGGAGRPGIVHRLDKWTSGLLIVAKNDWAHARLSRAFHDRLVEKTYLALVHGKMSRPSGEIDLNIARHSTIRTRMTASPNRGRTALSLFRVLEQVGGFTLLEVTIKTGRTHQIRVHLSAVGHPVVGDKTYGEKQYREFIKKFGDPGRYFLHAAVRKFRHPRTGDVQEYRSPLPGDLQDLLGKIRESS